MLRNETLSSAPVAPETEAEAYAFLEQLRWGNDGPTECPHCGSEKGAWYLKPKDPEGRKSKGGSAARSQRRVWKCSENSCRRQFSALTNTVLQATKMPVRAWVGTIFDLCDDPSGVSARDIAARWDVTEKSAWAMLNRIQDALTQSNVDGAFLDLTTPLWFEVSAELQALIDQQKRDQGDAEIQAASAKKKADGEASERIERDVQRALSEAPQQAKVTAAPPNRVIARRAEARSKPPESAADTKLAGRHSGVAPRLNSGSGELISEPATEAGTPISLPVSAPVDRLTESQERRDPGATDQVKSDVERVLAEVFGDAVPAKSKAMQDTEVLQNQVANPATTAQPAGSNQVPTERRTRPVSESVNQASTRTPAPDVRPEVTVKASKTGIDVGPEAATTGTRSATGLVAGQPKKFGKQDAKVEHKNKKRRASAERRAQAKRVEQADPQAADSHVPAGTSAENVQDGSGVDRTAHTEDRRDPMRDAEVSLVGADRGDDSLGRGWLDRPTEMSSGSERQVSSDQGQLSGVDASELGPAWASNEAIMLPDTQQDIEAPEG